MIKLFPKPLLAVMTMLFIVALGSCDKDSEGTSAEIELLSFGPTGAAHGDTLRFIGNNLDKVTAIQFTGLNAVVEKANFKSQTAHLILLLVPEAAEKGKVTLKTPQGDIVSKTILNLGVLPVVQNMTAEARPGADITITGDYMNWVKSVTFAKNIEVKNFVSQSLNQLVVKVPTNAETGPLVITYSGTDSGAYETEDTLKVTLPKGNTISPALLYHGENVTISGTNLDLVKKVYFTNVATAVTSFVSQSLTELVVTVPATALKGPIKLEAASGVQTTVTGELDVKLPRATGISPAVVKHLENITITGTDLNLVAKVYFTNAPTPVTSFVSQSATQLVVQVPAATKKGPVKLEMASGIQTTSTAEVTVLLPAITSFAPSPVDPGANLTITGTNLDLVTAVVLENVAPITNFVSQSPTQIVLTVPNGVANGLITLKVLNSTVTVLSADILQITGTAPDPTIANHFYADAITWPGWIGGGWGGAKDENNASPVRVGTKSVKIDYTSGAYGSPLQLGGASISLASYTTFKISIYPTAAMAGKKIKIVFNGSGGYLITLGAAGQWTDFAIPLGNISAATTLTEIWIQEPNGNAGTIYVDEIGLN